MGEESEVDEMPGTRNPGVLALRPEGQAAQAAARLDEELARVTRALTDVTGLLALATAPATGGIVRHVEVLDLGSGKICTVCITAEGEVARHVERFSSSVDPGLIQWVQEYVNERLTGVQLGRHLLRTCLNDAQLTAPERAVLAAVLPAFLELVESTGQIHVGGTPALLTALGDEVSQLIDLVAALDERRRLLESMSRLAGVALGPGRVSIRIGAENDLPELQPLSVVGARYGSSGIPAGFVGVIGPRYMDYPQVVAAVAEAATHLGWTAADR
jgi:heat-inducible transcriptional repressor